MLSIHCVFQVVHKAGNSGGPHSLMQRRRMQFLFETKTNFQHLPLSRPTRKSFTQTFPYRHTQQAAARSICGCHGMLRTKEQPFLFPYGTTVSGLCKKNSFFLLLSLTRARTEAVYIANSRRRSISRRKVNRNPKSKDSWWKKRLRQC